MAEPLKNEENLSSADSLTFPLREGRHVCRGRFPAARTGKRLQKNRLQKTILISSLLLTALLPGAYAQSASSKLHVGTVNVGFPESHADPRPLALDGTGEDYVRQLRFECRRHQSLFRARRQNRSVRAAPGSRRRGRGFRLAGDRANIRRPLESETFEIYSDKAVYLPEPSRPSGGEMTFTGHVKVITKSGFFAGPSTSTVESATVLLGNSA